MIAKQDIVDRAAAWHLAPEVVEKDYVLGWLLAAVASHPVTSATWVFKGGTSIKKTVVETYRFSEDLDFSLLPDASYDEASIQRVLTDIGDGAAKRSGIQCPAEQTTVHLGGTSRIALHTRGVLATAARLCSRVGRASAST